jgi:hypothetical protein
MIKHYKEVVDLSGDSDLGNYLVCEEWGVYFHSNHGHPTGGTPPYKGVGIPWDTLNAAQTLYKAKRFEEVEVMLMAALIRGG